LKLQILNTALSEVPSKSEPNSLAHDNAQDYRRDLRACYDEWSRDIEQFSISDGQNQKVSINELKAWGWLQYYETLMFLHPTETGSQTQITGNPQVSQDLCDQFIQACTTLNRCQ
jgi:hypothetical protein